MHPTVIFRGKWDRELVLGPMTWTWSRRGRQIEIPTTRHLKTKIGTLNYLRTTRFSYLNPPRCFLNKLY